MASRYNGTLYIGSTTDLVRRAWEHRSNAIVGFSRRYGCHLLVWYEVHDSIGEARHRERQMKEWKRSWKIEKIVALNPRWNDLAPTLV